MNLRKCWGDAIHRAATATRRTRTLLTPLGVAVFAAFTGLFVLAAVTVDRALGLPPLLEGSARLLVSLPLMAAGLLVTAWSAYHFVRVKGTPVPFNPPPEVVRTGPYRYVRNPMLTGVFLLLFGIGFFVGSVSLVVVFTPLYVACNVWELRNIEEPELTRRFGEEYRAYREQTPTFFPRLRARRK